MIKFNAEKKTFIIETQKWSYVFGLNEVGTPLHIYFGEKLYCADDLSLRYGSDLARFVRYSNIFYYPQEYVTYERGVYDEECLKIEQPDGITDVSLNYVSHSIDDNVLTITLQDSAYKTEVKLVYELFEKYNLMRRKAIITDVVGGCKLKNFKSASLYLPMGKEYEVRTYSGAWAREYIPQTNTIFTGKMEFSTNRTSSSGPHHSSFFAVYDKELKATESEGKVYFGTLEYSGNFKNVFEKNQTGVIKIVSGINDTETVIDMQKGQSFETPSLLFGYTDAGFGDMSKSLYAMQYDVLCPRIPISKPFPIIYNSWYPYEFNIDEEKLLAFLPKVKEIGAELFVIDDGWMQGRVDDKHGLGDWFVDKQRFPNGLKPISDKAHELGLLFGLWVEPEMLNKDSELFNTHPEWVLKYPTREPSLMRNQMVLDLTREDVVQFCIDMLDRVINEYKLDYLKWDMNRYVSERTTDKDFFIKYTNNLMRIFKHIRTTYPTLLIENCAHGGARTDYGLLPYSDRINRSDNADPIDVLKLHEGFTTFMLPRYAGGAGNVTTLVNGINKRTSPLLYRARLGMTGSMSVGFNLLTVPQSDIDEIKEHLKFYKTIRPVLHNAYFYRLSSVYKSNVAIWQYVARDDSKSVVFVFAHNQRFGDGWDFVKLQGLCPTAKYSVNGEIFSGDTLMKWGLKINRPFGDYYSDVIVIEKCE